MYKNMDLFYKEKYIKYKQKYLEKKKSQNIIWKRAGGSSQDDQVVQQFSLAVLCATNESKLNERWKDHINDQNIKEVKYFGVDIDNVKNQNVKTPSMFDIVLDEHCPILYNKEFIDSGIYEFCQKNLRNGGYLVLNNNFNRFNNLVIEFQKKLTPINDSPITLKLEHLQVYKYTSLSLAVLYPNNVSMENNSWDSYILNTDIIKSVDYIDVTIDIDKTKYPEKMFDVVLYEHCPIPDNNYNGINSFCKYYLRNGGYLILNKECNTFNVQEFTPITNKSDPLYQDYIKLYTYKRTKLN